MPSPFRPPLMPSLRPPSIALLLVLMDWLIDWLNDWLIDWLINGLLMTTLSIFLSMTGPKVVIVAVVDGDKYLIWRFRRLKKTTNIMTLEDEQQGGCIQGERKMKESGRKVKGERRKVGK